jgi:hypothetical protein
MFIWWPCHLSGGYSPASQSGGLGSRPCQCVWDLWWTNWHWDMFSFEISGFPLSASFCCDSSYSYIIWGMNNRLFGGRSSETSPHPIYVKRSNFSHP